MIFAIFLSALGDMIWGGQAGKFSRTVNEFRRILAPALVILGLIYSLGLAPAFISGTGYVAVRILGWRFKPANDELFLGMERPIHVLYAMVYGLGFLIIPAASYFLLGSDLLSGLSYWAVFASIIPLPWAFIMLISRRLNKDLVPLKEAVWGAMFGAAAFYYFSNVKLSSWLNLLG